MRQARPPLRPNLLAASKPAFVRFFANLAKPSQWKGKFKMAGVTGEKVCIGSAPCNRRKDRPRFVVNPATGALEVPAHLRAKVSKALRREACRSQLRRYLRSLDLYLLKLLLESRAMFLRVRCYLSGHFPDLFRKRHGSLSVPKKEIYASEHASSVR